MHIAILLRPSIRWNGFAIKVLFLNSSVRDAEMQNTEYADFNWEKFTLHVQPQPWRHFRLKGKKKKKFAKGQTHSDPGEARLEDQGQNARTECPAARSGLPKRKWKT